MPKLALIATIEVVEGQRDRLLPLLRAHGARSLKDEPGTLQFETLVPREDDTKLLVYEVFRDDAAFEEHQNAASIARFRKETDGMFEKIYSTRCTPAE
jgi:(4S)-4-hydroxy-5-phosphonooxypentane-2,3-dione isomerase